MLRQGLGNVPIIIHGAQDSRQAYSKYEIFSSVLLAFIMKTLQKTCWKGKGHAYILCAL